jgi:hypothetical protein
VHGDYHPGELRLQRLPAFVRAHNARTATQAITLAGRIAIDNNRVENAIRPAAVGKKNWLFIGPSAKSRFVNASR